MSMKAEIYGALAATGIPGRFEAYAVGRAPAPPFFIYEVRDWGEIYADGTTYARTPHVHVELFEKVSDSGAEEKMRQAIETAFGPVEETGAWSQSEDCHIEQYDFTYTGGKA